MSIRIRDTDGWREINELYRFDGGQWRKAELSRFDGTGWQLVWPCHFVLTKEYPLSAFMVSKGTDPLVNQYQIPDPEYIISGSPKPFFISESHDSLLFFDMDRLRADLSGALLMETSLRMTRLSADIDEGLAKAKVMIGSALSGVDLSRTDNLWPREFTELLDSHYLFALGETATVSFNVSGVADLLSGAADCLCLPTTGIHTATNESYCVIDPDSVALVVTYLS